jgi:hypothetical protein
MAMIPENSDEGDILRVLYGSKFPNVLRNVPGKEDTCTLIGSALMKSLGGLLGKLRAYPRKSVFLEHFAENLSTKANFDNFILYRNYLE